MKQASINYGLPDKRSNSANLAATKAVRERVFELYVNQQRSVVEVAAQLNCSTSAVRKCMRRSGIKLRKSDKLMGSAQAVTMTYRQAEILERIAQKMNQPKTFVIRLALDTFFKSDVIG